ncbi:MAG: NAD(P)-binding domain-containing protein [Elusimicrobiota bacterium]
MDWPFIVIVSTALIATFALVSVWQRAIERENTSRNLAAIKDAHSRGKHRAIAQHPIVQTTLCVGCGTCVEVCPEEEVLGLVNGIAEVINGSRCVGHAKCAQCCPMEAMTVGLGDIALRPDIPILAENLETSLPGVYISGELGGIALIKHAINHGVRAIDEIALKFEKESVPRERDVFDVLIVGAGPAGLSASLRAIEKKLTYVTITKDDIGGTIRKYPRRKLTLVQTVEIPLYGRLPAGEYEKERLLTLWEKLIETFKVRVKTKTELLAVARQGAHYEVKTSAGELRCRCIVLAMGRRGSPRKLGVPGEELDKVLYQLFDAATYKNLRILIVGGGDSAIEAATALANQSGNTVTIVYRKGEFFRLKSRNEQRIKEYASSGRVKVLFNTEVERVDPQSVDVRPSQGGGERLRLPNDFVFVFAGGELPFPLLKGMGIRFGGDSPGKARATAQII